MAVVTFAQTKNFNNSQMINARRSSLELSIMTVSMSEGSQLGHLADYSEGDRGGPSKLALSEIALGVTFKFTYRTNLHAHTLPAALPLFVSGCLPFVAGKCLRKSEPCQNNCPFVAGFRVVRDIFSDDLYKFVPLNRLLWRAESAWLEMQSLSE